MVKLPKIPIIFTKAFDKYVTRTSFKQQTRNRIMNNKNCALKRKKQCIDHSNLKMNQW